MKFVRIVSVKFEVKSRYAHDLSTYVTLSKLTWQWKITIQGVLLVIDRSETCLSFYRHVDSVDKMLHHFCLAILRL